MLRQVSAIAATLKAVSRISWGQKHVVKSYILSCLHLEEHQEIFEHDFEGEEKVEQEGGAYWDQGLQNIEDDVADEVVEGDERREDVEGCSRDAVKSFFVNIEMYELTYHTALCSFSTCLLYPQPFVESPTWFWTLVGFVVIFLGQGHN